METYPHKFETCKTPMGDPMEQNKKMVAAVSAVLNYLKEEEEMMCVYTQTTSQPKSEIVPVSAPASVAGQWAISGRGEQMQLRNMMQMKAFHR